MSMRQTALRFLAFQNNNSYSPPKKNQNFYISKRKITESVAWRWRTPIRTKEKLLVLEQGHIWESHFGHFLPVAHQPISFLVNLYAQNCKTVYSSKPHQWTDWTNLDHVSSTWEWNTKLGNVVVMSLSIERTNLASAHALSLLTVFECKILIIW